MCVILDSPDKGHFSSNEVKYYSVYYSISAQLIVQYIVI